MRMTAGSPLAISRSFVALGGQKLAFSHYVSLGSNCEIAFQFRRILGRDSSSFFSWNVTSFEALTSLLSSEFAGILEDDNIVPHTVPVLSRDLGHDYLFHNPFGTDNPRDDPEFHQKLEAHRSKAKHLCDKFLDQARSGEPTVYFYRTEENDVRAKASIVRDRLADICGETGHFWLVVIQSADRREDDWQEPFISNRYLTRLAPFNDATDGHVSSYDHIFREFPYNGEMHFSGY